jgi:hypothetical protein
MVINDYAVGWGNAKLADDIRQTSSSDGSFVN